MYGALFSCTLGDKSSEGFMSRVMVALMMVVMIVTAVRDVGAARMRNRIASHCIWGRMEPIAHEVEHAGHLYIGPYIGIGPSI